MEQLNAWKAGQPKATAAEKKLAAQYEVPAGADAQETDKEVVFRSQSICHVCRNNYLQKLFSFELKCSKNIL